MEKYFIQEFPRNEHRIDLEKLAEMTSAAFVDVLLKKDGDNEAIKSTNYHAYYIEQAFDKIRIYVSNAVVMGLDMYMYDLKTKEFSEITRFTNSDVEVFNEIFEHGLKKSNLLRAKKLETVMTPSEASDRWAVPYDTLRSRLGGRTISMQKDLEQSLKDGLIKRYKANGKQRYEWLLTVEIMEKWYGPENK